ncbi:MAG TPA: group 1 truncated hemoglobin [Longimicrobiales bacterium]|nr:group 1 truncated hemoglobin [Longimicrobiales bacterium]
MRGRTVFESVGGFARVRLIVADFYERILASERLGRFFADIDMRRLVDHQTKFVAALMGGPASYSDEQMARAHQRLGISHEDFDEMALLFGETLEDFGLEPLVVRQLCAHVQGMRDHVVAPQAVTPQAQGSA